jgi:two-component system sensor histidine kinase UhpB
MMNRGQVMDLRRRLVGYLGGLLMVLLLVTTLINLYSLRSDVADEVIASEQLVRVLLESSQIESGLSPPEAAARLEAILNRGPLRHLTVSIDAAPSPESSAFVTTRLAGMLGVESATGPGQLIRVGDQMLRITPNPASEIEERLDDMVRFCVTLLFFSGAVLLVAWWSADRALKPVLELDAGLQRLARGETDAALPAFALREFKQIADAIDNLTTALSTSREAQQQLSRRLILVQEDERRALARDLHDEMGQTLTAIGITAAYFERHAGQLDAEHIVECARDLRRDVRTSGEQLRAMLKRLRPHGLDGHGLASALRELLVSWQQRESRISFTLDMPATLPALGEDAGLALYRVVQEALTNVVRHSRATHCRVKIEANNGVLSLRVEDDGCGLSQEERCRGGGLLGIEERLRMVGGNLEIGPGPESGVHLQISLPLT